MEVASASLLHLVLQGCCAILRTDGSVLHNISVKTIDEHGLNLLVGVL